MLSGVKLTWRRGRRTASLCLSSLILAGPVLALTAAWPTSAGATKAPVAPSITSTSGLMIVGKSKTLRIIATGSPKPAITESGALPAGVTFTSGDGVAELTGTPAAGTGNDYNITFTATNSAGTDADEPYDLEVVQEIVYPSNFCPPAMTVGQYTHDDQSVQAYPPFFGLGTNSQTAPDAISFTQDPDYSPNSITEDFGWTSGTPPAGSGGKYRIQYEADVSSNVGNINQDKNFNCTLIIDEAPTFTDAGTSVITAGTKLAAPLFIGGQTGYPKSISVNATGTLPEGLAEQIKAGSKTFGVQLRGDPKAATPGDYPITVTGDNGLTSSEEYVLVVVAPNVTPAATTTALSTEPSDVTYNASSQTYTATVTGGTSPTGYVQFSIGNGITTVPLVDGQASYTTPASLDVNDYTVTATYTGDAGNASSTTSEDFSVDPDPTTLSVTSTPSVANGTSSTVTATVACSPSCGTTPTGYVEFDEDGDDNYSGNSPYDVELVDGQATFETDSTASPALGNEVDATFSPYSDSPGDFAPSTTESVYYDIGATTLGVVAGDGVAADGTNPVANGDTVTVDPTSTNELSADLEAVVGGNGTPPGPLDIDVVVGTTDETSTLFTQSSEEDAPSSDAGTGATDYYWTIPANALTSIASSGTGTVTISSPGSDDFVPISETFTLDW